jgi:3-(3-hydroxy-phenyl)propionate hydroxylase
MATQTAPEEHTSETDVVIVGFGPVGATLANLLGMQGIKTLVLEREPAIYNLPRAVHFCDEIMRLLQTVGLAEAVRPLVHVSPGMKFVDDAGRLLLDWPRRMERGPQGWPESYRCHQPELERALREALGRFPSVTVRLRSEVFALDEKADSVEVRYEDLRPAVSRGAGPVTLLVATGRGRWCGG